MTESERDKESIRILRNALILTLTRMCVHQPNHPKFAVRVGFSPLASSGRE